MDAVFWSSAIFSRQAMAVNHVSPHKYGDRKALGLYRMFATFVMMVLFSFLTVYDVLITHNRFYFTLTWWVSLGTLLFFALSLVGYQAYMGDKPINPRTAEDGSHPFYDWKIVAIAFSLAMQAALHLTALEYLQTKPKEVYDQQYLNYLMPVITYAPLGLLTIDWLFNRIYLPLTIVINYSYWAYAFALLNYLVRADVADLFPMPELFYFQVQPNKLAWALPIAISASLYLAIRLKFWYVGEGDLVFDLDEWARKANERMEHIENDGAREEESFKFNVASGGDASDPQLDYTDPNTVKRQAKGRDAYNRDKSGRHKRLTNQWRRASYYLDKDADKK